MTKTIFAAVVLALSGPALGSMIAADDLSYSDGDLWGSNGGTGDWSSIWSGTAMNVSGGWMIGANTVTDPKYGSRNFNNPGTTGQLFVAIDLRTPASFMLNDYAAVYLTVGVNNSCMVFGKAPGSNELQIGNGGFTPTGIEMQPDTVYHLIAAYDSSPQPDRLSLWVNPDAADYYDPLTAESSADTTRIDFVAFHCATLTFATNTAVGFAADNVVIGNTPDAVGLLSAAPCQCPGDMTRDGIRDASDVQGFATCLTAGGSCACADMNATSGANLDDVGPFVDALLNDVPCPP